MNEEKKLYTTAEAAEWIAEHKKEYLKLKEGGYRGVSRQTVLQWIWDKRLEARRFGRSWMIHIDDLREFIPPPMGNPDHRQK